MNKIHRQPNHLKYLYRQISIRIWMKIALITAMKGTKIAAVTIDYILKRQFNKISIKPF